MTPRRAEASNPHARGPPYSVGFGNNQGPTMQRSLALLLCAAGASLSIAAQAAMPVRAADLPAGNNGSTGYVGLSASAGMHAQRTDARTAMAATPGGELTTFVDGRPNAAMDVAASGRHSQAGEGRFVSARDMAGMNPSWGTPD